MGGGLIDFSKILGPEWQDPWWRLNNLYWILDVDGNPIPFIPNEEQEEFYRNLRPRNLILKARQMGFSTFIEILQLDQALFNQHFNGVVLADTRENAGKLFRKVKFAFERLPAEFARAVETDGESRTEYIFGHGSTISVGTSSRGGTVQLLHVSEMGKTARKFPERAREIVTGAFESVPADGIVIVESTAEGNSGEFYDLVIAALRRMQAKAPESQLDWRLHFFPWYRKRSNRLPTQGVTVTAEQTRYFNELEQMLGITLDQYQRAWYAKKSETLGDDMKREHPSTPEEAFQQAVDGVIYAKQLTLLRRLGRIGSVPLRPDVPVNTFWDLGVSDTNCIWLHQRVGIADRFVGYMQGSGYGMGHWWSELEAHRLAHGYRWGTHHLPHDGKQRIQGFTVQTREQMLQELSAGQAIVVSIERTADRVASIEGVRAKLMDCYIDEKACAEGLKGLDNYQYEWIEAAGHWSRNPLHNWASNPADAFRTWAEGYAPEGPRAVRQVASTVYVRGTY